MNSITLPDKLLPAFDHFNDALRKHHGFTITPLHYLRLTLDAASTPGEPAQGGWVYVKLLISGQRIGCIYDPRGSGALITCFWAEPVIPRRERMHKSDHVDAVTGQRLKSRQKGRKHKIKPYRRPAPGEL